jgi:hypothetical protein
MHSKEKNVVFIVTRVFTTMAPKKSNVTTVVLSPSKRVRFLGPKYVAKRRAHGIYRRIGTGSNLSLSGAKRYLTHMDKDVIYVPHFHIAGHAGEVERFLIEQAIEKAIIKEALKGAFGHKHLETAEFKAALEEAREGRRRRRAHLAGLRAKRPAHAGKRIGSAGSPKKGAVEVDITVKPASPAKKGKGGRKTKAAKEAEVEIKVKTPSPKKASPKKASPKRRASKKGKAVTADEVSVPFLNLLPLANANF